jgi:chorismate dehydratase
MRLGRIGYINCFPVYGAIDRGIVSIEADLVTGTPSELNGLLAAGALDVSVISAVEYARDAEQYVLLPDLAVSCDGPVRSVALFSHRPVESLHRKTVLVSASSRTSVFLLELLCRDVWGVTPNFVQARTEAEDLASLTVLPHAGVLVIGDAALLLAARNVYRDRYDLGEEWKRWTGLPFVFAVWAARRGKGESGKGKGESRVRGVHQSLLASREWGLNHLKELAGAAAEHTGLSVDVCSEYLDGLDYGLSYGHIEGLTSFFRRLSDRGSVPKGTLRFLAVA